MNSTKHRIKIVTQSITMSQNNKEHRITQQRNEMDFSITLYLNKTTLGGNIAVSYYYYYYYYLFSTTGHRERHRSSNRAGPFHRFRIEKRLGKLLLQDKNRNSWRTVLRVTTPTGNQSNAIMPWLSTRFVLTLLHSYSEYSTC
jgi:hypothetical protein